jgi:hypothetical protein
MKQKRKNKLLLISPTGREYQVGFLSPCRNGFVLGISQIEQVDSSHLTIIRKKGTLSAHITAQRHPKERRYFLPISTTEVAKRFQSLIENKMVFQLSPEQLSEEVFYITEKMGDWYNALIKALYQKKRSEKEVVHILNFKRLIEQLPGLIDKLKESPQLFFGICRAKDILKDSSIIAGFSRSRTLIIPVENELIGVDFRIFTSFDFTPSMNQLEISNPLTEIYQSMGIPQYIREIQERRFLEKLLSKES